MAVGVGIDLMENFGVTVSRFVNLIGLIVVTIGVVKAVFGTLKDEYGIIQQVKSISSLMHVRRNLAIYLLLWLEFFLAADIIDTMIHFDMHNLLLLGLLVVIRIVIGYVLEKEIQEYEHEHPKEIAKEEHRPKKKRGKK